MSDPESRNEALLGNLLGESNEFGEPQSANEAILQNILGANNVLREPQSRIESMLKEILDGGGMGGADMTVSLRGIMKSGTSTLSWAFSKAGTFYVTVVGAYNPLNSPTAIYRPTLTETAGAAITSSKIKNTSGIYAYKLVVAESETENDMKFSITSDKDATISIYYSASTWYADIYDTVPFKVN